MNKMIEAEKTDGTVPIHVLSLNDLRRQLEDEIYEKTNGVVQAGPFKGMQMYPDKSWKETNHAAELLGFFEQELHEDIEHEIARLEAMPSPCVVNVGCAEGYYAVGMGRRLLNAKVYVIEPDEKSLYIAKKNAENNGVSLVVAPIEEAFECPDLVLMDCEGAETEYLDPVKYPGLRNATVIVELHQLPGKSDVLDAVKTKMATHGGKLVFEGARNPNASPLLWAKNSLDRWLVVCESRPCVMAWAVLKPEGT